MDCEIQYLGRIWLDKPVQELYSGQRDAIEFGQTYYYTQPLLTSSSDALRWVNRTVFIAMGKSRDRGDGNWEVVYRIFKVE